MIIKEIFNLLLEYKLFLILLILPFIGIIIIDYYRYQRYQRIINKDLQKLGKINESERVSQKFREFRNKSILKSIFLLLLFYISSIIYLYFPLIIAEQNWFEKVGYFFISKAGYFFIITSGCIILIGLYKCYRAYISREWPRVVGIVKNAEIKEEFDAEGGDIYRLNINYSYNVSGIQYESKRIKFIAHRYSSYDAAEKILKELVVDSKVQVYYNPKKPSDAVLMHGITIGPFVILLVGVFVSCVGIFIKNLTA